MIYLQRLLVISKPRIIAMSFYTDNMERKMVKYFHKKFQFEWYKEYEVAFINASTGNFIDCPILQEEWNKYGIPKSTFLRARDQLIKVGLIEIAEDGGCHHTTKYAISNNWRNYPEQTFERSKSGNLVGTKTRWKKDTVISGTNNLKSTVISGTNSNPNGTENDA